MDIEKVVFHALTQFLALAQKEAIQNREVGDLRKSAIKECADKIRTLQKQNEQHKASKLRLYEKYAAGSITKEAYIQQKAAADVKIAENDGAIQRSHERMKELDSETACSDEKLDAVCEQYADCKALTYELTHAFISAVYIYDLDNIEIVWKFKENVVEWCSILPKPHREKEKEGNQWNGRSYCMPGGRNRWTSRTTCPNTR